MRDLVCPKCEKIVRYDDYSQAYTCKYCGWRKDVIPPAEILEFQKEITALKERIKEYEKELRVGDKKYCVYNGSKTLRAGVFLMELQQITAKASNNAYSFFNLETDEPQFVVYRRRVFERTFDNREDAEKMLRKLLRKRHHQDGRVRALIPQKEIAAENRRKAREMEDDEDDEIFYQ